MAGTIPRVSIKPKATPGTFGEGVAAGLATADLPPDPVLDPLLRRVVVVAREVVVAGAALAGVDAAAEVLATGFTSTVLFAAAEVRVVRRRGVGEGVAMAVKVWKRNGNGGGRWVVPIRPDSRNR